MDGYVNNDYMLELNLQFFAKDGPGGEKTEPATAKKLQDVRKDGQTAKSKELITAISLMSLFILIKIYVGVVGQKFTEVFKDIYGTFQKVADSSDNGMRMADAVSSVREVLMSSISIAVPIFIVAVVVGILCNSLQQKWMVTAKPLQPKMSKISPASGFKRIFSFRQLFELIKSIAMMFVIGIMSYVTIKDKVNILLTFYDISLNAALKTVGDIIVDLGIKISTAFLIVGFVDLIRNLSLRMII